jgi:hypothetical protein
MQIQHAAGQAFLAWAANTYVGIGMPTEIATMELAEILLNVRQHKESLEPPRPLFGAEAPSKKPVMS